MPFQGDSNAGAPSPALLQLLFQQKQRREELAYQQQKDAVAAQRQAMLDAEEQRRKEEAHKLELLQKRFDLASKLKDYGANVDSARRNAETQNAAPLNAQGLQQQDLFSNGGGNDFANIVLQNDPAAAQQVQEANAANAYYASTLAGGAPIANEVAPGVDPIKSLLGAGQAVETQRAREASLAKSVKVGDEQRAEERAIAADKRLEARQVRSDLRQEAINARSGIKEVEAENRAIADKMDAAEKAKEKGNDRLYNLLKDDVDVIVAKRNAKLTAGQPEWAGRDTALLVKQNSALDNYVSQAEVLKALVEHPDVLGSNAAFRSFVGNAVNVVGDLGLAVAPTIEAYKNDERIPQDVRNTMYNAIVRGVREDNTPIATAELAAIRTRWLILNALDPGRVAVAQLNDMEDATQFNGLLISQKRAVERARASLNEIRQGINSAQRNVKLIRPEAEFEDSGRLKIDGLLPIDSASSIFTNGAETTPPVGVTPGIGTTTTNPIEILQEGGSLNDAIEAAKKNLKDAAKNRSVSGKKIEEK